MQFDSPVFRIQFISHLKTIYIESEKDIDTDFTNFPWPGFFQGEQDCNECKFFSHQIYKTTKLAKIGTSALAGTFITDIYYIIVHHERLFGCWAVQ